MLKGAREQTAVRLQQCFPRSLAVNEEDNKGGCLTRQCCCQTHDVCASCILGLEKRVENMLILKRAKGCIPKTVFYHEKEIKCQASLL